MCQKKRTKKKEKRKKDEKRHTQKKGNEEEEEKEKKRRRKRKKDLSPSLSTFARVKIRHTRTRTHTHTRTHAHILLRNIMQPPQTPSRDRFIANRSAIDLDVARYALDSSANNNRGGGRDDDDDDDDADDNHRGGGRRRRNARRRESRARRRTRNRWRPIIRCRPEEEEQGAATMAARKSWRLNQLRHRRAAWSMPRADMYTSNIHVGGGVSKGNGGNGGGKKQFRHIPQAPERILDAPELVDDYYLNLIDWSSQDSIAVALGCTVYLWNAGTGAIDQLMQTDVEYDEEDYVTSVNWAPDGKHIAVGTNNAEVQIWDASRARKVRTLKGHDARVGALAWSGTQLATGSRDTTVKTHDVRIREHCTNTFTFHEQEVCGLKWSPSGTQLASGGERQRVAL